MSCLTLVLATQHWPLGTTRPWFWRAMMTLASWGAAETKPTAARKRVARDSCMVAVGVGGFGGGGGFCRR